MRASTASVIGSLAVAVLGATVLAGCEPTGTVNFQTGELQFTVGTDAFALPTELRDGTTIGSVPCEATSACPSTAEVPVSCQSRVCDPDPTTIVVPVGEVIDFEAIRAEAPQPFSHVEEIHLRAIDYFVQLNTLTVDIGPVDLLWAPEGAASGMTHLGTIAPITAKTTPSASVQIDPAGEEALSDFLLGTSARVRFFAASDVDLSPGGPFPEGDLEVAVVMSLTAVGPLL